MKGMLILLLLLAIIFRRPIIFNLDVTGPAILSVMATAITVSFVAHIMGPHESPLLLPVGFVVLVFLFYMLIQKMRK